MKNLTLTTRIKSVFVAAAAICLVGALPGIGCKAGPKYHSPDPFPTCNTPDECEAGETCSLDGYCMPMASPAMNLAVELVPQEGVDQDSQGNPLTRMEVPPDVAAASFDNQGWLQVAYPTPAEMVVDVNVNLLVAMDRDPYDDVFEAAVSISRPSKIPGRPRVLYTADVAYNIMNPGVGNETALMYLPLGETYRVRVTPEGYYANDFPPLVRRDVLVDSDTELTFEFGQDTQFINIQGTVRDAANNPIAGVQAQLLDSEGIYTSSVSEPTNVEGTFNVWVSAGERDYTLVLKAADGADPRPTLEFDVHVVGEANQLPTEVIGVFNYPALPNACSFTIQVAGKSTSGISDPVPGATVILSATVGGGTNDDGVYEVKTTTDSAGYAQMMVIPSDQGENRIYHAKVVPPAESPFAAHVQTVSVAAPTGPNECGTGQTVEVDPRVELHGVVRASAGGPVEDLTIEARPTNTEENQSTGAWLTWESGFTPTDVTDPEGLFFMRLDTGAWDFELVPPSGSMLPRWLVTGIEVSLEGELPQPFSVPMSAVLLGRVLNTNADPVEFMTVKVYLVAADCLPGGENADNCPTPALYLGESDVLPDGNFQVIVPRL